MNLSYTNMLIGAIFSCACTYKQHQENWQETCDNYDEMESKLMGQQINVGPEDPPYFTWPNLVLGNSIAVHTLDGVEMWSVSRNKENFISSPIAYGAEPDGDIVNDAQILFPGNSYTVTLLVGCVMTRRQYNFDERSEMLELTGEFVAP